MMRRFTSFAVITLALLMIVAAAQAQTSTGPRRPAGVPADFVITPFGYYHPSCVNHLAAGDVLRSDKKGIDRADGTFHAITCAYPHYRADGEKVIGDERGVKDPNISHAWVEWASVYNTASSYGFQWGFWNVPPAPLSKDGQTLYFFNGLEDINDVVTIIQPVLGWNSDYANAWGIAAWNCCVNGAVNEGPPTPVASGDLIYGYTFETCGSGIESCGTWDIVAWDLTNRNFSDLVNTSSYGQTFNWAFGGVLEVYNVIKCNDYPDGNADGYVGAGPSIHFYNQGLEDYNFVTVKNPAWTIGRTTGLSPGCGYGGSSPREVVLKY